LDEGLLARGTLEKLVPFEEFTQKLVPFGEIRWFTIQKLVAFEDFAMFWSGDL
jgi:hypothetical protein